MTLLKAACLLTYALALAALAQSLPASWAALAGLAPRAAAALLLVHALELLELQPKARIQGDVHYTSLEMHQGAIISGQLLPTVGRAEEKPTLKLASNNG